MKITHEQLVKTFKGMGYRIYETWPGQDVDFMVRGDKRIRVNGSVWESVE